MNDIRLGGDDLREDRRVGALAVVEVEAVPRGESNSKGSVGYCKIAKLIQNMLC